MVTQSLAAAKRLRKELQVLKQDDHIYLQANPDNILLWKAWIKGPEDTPFAGGVFQLDIRCGVDYPLAPPTIKFVTKVRTRSRREQIHFRRQAGAARRSYHRH